MSESIVESNDTEVLNFSVGGESNGLRHAASNPCLSTRGEGAAAGPGPGPAGPAGSVSATNAVSAGANTVTTAVSAAELLADVAAVRVSLGAGAEVGDASLNPSILF